MKWTLLFLGLSCSLAAGQPSRPRILGVARISFFAHDFERSSAFYREFLGFEEAYTLRNPDGSPKVTSFKVNDRQYVELSPERAPNTDRLNHLSIQTDDAKAMRAYLVSKGIKLTNKIHKDQTGDLKFTVDDPDGHELEIVQYEPDSWTTRGKGKHLSGDRISETDDARGDHRDGSGPSK